MAGELSGRVVAFRIMLSVILFNGIRDALLTDGVERLKQGVGSLGLATLFER